MTRRKIQKSRKTQIKINKIKTVKTKTSKVIKRISKMVRTNNNKKTKVNRKMMSKRSHRDCQNLDLLNQNSSNLQVYWQKFLVLV